MKNDFNEHAVDHCVDNIARRGERKDYIQVSMRGVWVSLFLLWAFPVVANPVISEFMAANETTLADEDGDFSDWIEISNSADQPVDLAGYYLTDNPQVLNRWVFPSVILDPGEWLVVFASGKIEMWVNCTQISSCRREVNIWLWFCRME